MLHNEGTKALNNNNNNNNSLFAPITVIHIFVCVYECYNNVHDNSEQELSGNPNGLIEESPCLQLSEL